MYIDPAELSIVTIVNVFFDIKQWLWIVQHIKTVTLSLRLEMELADLLSNVSGI